MATGRQEPKHTLPYAYTIPTAAARLEAIGARHSRDLRNPQFSFILDRLQRFRRSVNPSHGRVLVEAYFDENRSGPYGRQIDGRFASEEEAIQTAGEVLFTAFHGSQLGFIIETPEPSEHIVYEALCTECSEDAITYLHVAEYLETWHRSIPKSESAEDFVNSHYFGNPRLVAPHDKGRSFTYFAEVIHPRLFPDRPLPVDDPTFLNTIGNPHPTPKLLKTVGLQETTEINTAAAIQVRVRDAGIVGYTSALIEYGISVFMVYGRDHVIDQRAMFEERLGAVARRIPFQSDPYLRAPQGKKTGRRSDETPTR